MKRYKREDPVSYALGITLTFELLNYASEYARKVYVHSSMDRGEVFLKLEKLCRECHVPMEFSDKPFNILSQKENCYVIGEFDKFSRKLDYSSSHVVLNNPSNAGNMGTIMRSATGFGITNLAIMKPCVDPFDPKTVRASMGAIFRMNVEEFDSFADYKKKIGDRDTYPFMLKAKKKLPETEFTAPFSLIFGNEATGLPDSFLDEGTSVIIPHSNRIDSLNLPIAASIALYEATKKDF
ncbi:MAG: TrmH family RNA methyltransferase [Lachnospiraceae bacterium]|nr:TrmH family RNA methyltransferase [Lachnospiraceae bacterium]